MQIRSISRRAVVGACTAAVAGALTVGALTGLGTTAQAPAAVAAPVAAAVAATPPPADVPTTSLIAAEARARTPEQEREDRQRSIRASRMARIAKMRTMIVRVARRQIGNPYVAGREGPNAFDCSGLTRFVYKKVTGRELPHYSRAQYRMVTKIRKRKAQPGDLVFFFQNGQHHVGIYIGRGRMIDAPGAGRRVKISPISGDWWGRNYTGMGRVFPG